jgi:NAD(P)-dependent dehydrogenase (short-subunit alcohol dehydrogenase family)
VAGPLNGRRDMTDRKLCIVAAAGPGMGLAIARRFAREGYDLALIARDAQALQRLEAAIAAPGSDVRGYALDLSDLDALKATFARITAEQGPAEVLVYNGGAWHESAAMRLDPRLFNRDLALCVTGALACAQAVHPAMKAAGRGTILFTGGGLALYPGQGAGVASLTAGKSALRGFTYALARELAPEGIHVATVTIAGVVKPDTAFDPDRIAEEYWSLHVQPAGAWTVEMVFDGRVLADDAPGQV